MDTRGMKTYAGRFWLLLLMMAANTVWAGIASPIESIGNNVYSLTVKANNKFTRDTQKLKDQALELATQFCTKDGKRLKVVALTEDKALLVVGSYSQATLTFKALAPGDPELAPQAATALGKPVVPASPVTEQLFADISRLDEMRKKGLLTDAEFESEKKKVLDRSK